MNKRAKMGVEADFKEVLRRSWVSREKPPEYLTKEETEAFFKAIPTRKIRDRLLFDLIYRHGLRKREAAYLEMKNVRDGRIWVGRLKKSISGEYPLHPVTQKLLKRYMADGKHPENPYLLNSRQSGKERSLGASTIFTLYQHYAHKAGLPKTKQHPHVLRHSIAVHLMNAGWDLADVQDWLGHKTITSTTIYAKITNKRRENNHERTLNSREIARTNW